MELMLLKQEKPQLEKTLRLIKDFLNYYEGNDLLEDFIVLYYMAGICYLREWIPNSISKGLEYTSKVEKLLL